MLDGTALCETLQAILPAEVIKTEAQALGVIERIRKCEIVPLISSLVLNAGSDDSGRLADVYRRYQSKASQGVVRGAFYHWMDEETAQLMERLLGRALEHARSQSVHLPGVLGGVVDWRIFDSETVTLRDKLCEVYPASGSAAGVKVHKELSVGCGCMVDYHLGPAREHDSPHLDVDERYRGMGLLVDLGYVSLKFIRDCERHDVKYVIRLKENWKPKVQRIARGELTAHILPGTDLDVALVDQSILLDGRCIDADVVIGQGSRAVQARLVAIPGPQNNRDKVHYLFYLTNLSRRTHGAKQVGELYRVRWEIECDNKLDKSGARLDQICATTASSVRILLYAALLHSLIADLLVHRDLLERVESSDTPRPPLHRLLIAHALRNEHVALLAALMDSTTAREHWDKLARTIVDQGQDPNWRRRPSVLDRLRGLTAPLGRPRRKSLRECPPCAAPFRRRTVESLAA